MITHEISVDQKLARELAKIAKRTGRPAASIASDALREYLDHTGRLLDDIDAGKSDVAAGRMYTVNEVKAHLVEKRAERRTKRKSR